MGRVVDEGKWAAWRRRLARFQRGGQTVAAFCDAEDVSVPSFYQWKRKLAGAPAGVVDRRSPAIPITARSFLLVRIEAAAVVEIELPNGVGVRVPARDVAAINAAVLAAGNVRTTPEEESP